MKPSDERFADIFKELKELSMESGTQLSSEEVREYAEIEILRKIVCEMQPTSQYFFSST